jgi:hypothetical protein
VVVVAQSSSFCISSVAEVPAADVAGLQVKKLQLVVAKRWLVAIVQVTPFPQQDDQEVVVQPEVVSEQMVI